MCATQSSTYLDINHNFNIVHFKNIILYLFHLQDPEKRPTAGELLKHQFVGGDLDPKPLRELLLEFRAEVVEEELLDDESEVRLFHTCINI